MAPTTYGVYRLLLKANRVHLSKLQLSEFYRQSKGYLDNYVKANDGLSNADMVKQILGSNDGEVNNPEFLKKWQQYSGSTAGRKANEGEESVKPRSADQSTMGPPQTRITVDDEEPVIINNPTVNRTLPELRNDELMMGTAELEVDPVEAKLSDETAEQFGVVVDDNRDGLGLTADNKLKLHNEMWEKMRFMDPNPTGFDRSQDLMLDMPFGVPDDFRPQLQKTQVLGFFSDLAKGQKAVEAAIRAQEYKPIVGLEGQFQVLSSATGLPMERGIQEFNEVIQTPATYNGHFNPVRDDAGMYNKNGFREIHDTWREEMFVVK